MSDPSKSVESHDGFLALHLCAEESFGVRVTTLPRAPVLQRDPVLPRDPQDLTKFHLLESFKFTDVSSEGYSDLTGGVQESRDYLHNQLFNLT